jgi:hypothetical protein
MQISKEHPLSGMVRCGKVNRLTMLILLFTGVSMYIEFRGKRRNCLQSVLKDGITRG